MNNFVSDGGYESEGVDEYLRNSFFPDYSYKGVFVDIGAFHSQWLSNSYHFEMNGWRVICVEPNPYCLKELSANRECVLPYAAYSRNENDVNFCIDKFAQNSVAHMAGASALEADYTPYSGIKEVVKVSTRTLDWMLEEQDVEKVDILSIDVEGSEIGVLEGTDLERWSPMIIVIENYCYYHKKSEEETRPNEQREYLENQGYALLKNVAYNDFYKREI